MQRGSEQAAAASAKLKQSQDEAALLRVELDDAKRLLGSAMQMAAAPTAHVPPHPGRHQDTQTSPSHHVHALSLARMEGALEAEAVAKR